MMTERVFRERMVPLPFEPSGIAVGAELFLGTFAILVWTVGNAKK